VSEVQTAELDAALSGEFPGLRLCWRTVVVRRRTTPSALVGQLGELAARFRGPDIVVMRTHPLPQAHRAFFRQIGLDPDVVRPPAEAAMFARLCQGKFEPHGNLVEDALLLATVETGIGVWAVDRDRVQLPLTLRVAAGERLVVADQSRTVADLFGEPDPPPAPRSSAAEMVIYAVGVPGVSQITLEEALWVAAEALSYGGRLD
jgi:antitoxin (DNA-binding transcriptional repressor) of toxin-antitoxin stability system